MLFARFLSRAAAQLNRPSPPIDHGIRRRLLEYDWPGNLRELSNFASRIAVGLDASDAPAAPGLGLVYQVQAYEAELIREALIACRGDIRGVLERLQIPRKTLYDKMARHQLLPSRYRLPGEAGG